MSLAGALADARKSATRVYINTFKDEGRQTTMDMLLVGLALHIELADCTGTSNQSIISVFIRPD